MKVLITGGAGFIGSHLADKLLNEKNEVFVIDNLSTGSMENIEHLKEKKTFHYVIDTIFNQAILRELIHKCDIVYHLAAAVGVFLIVQNPVNTIETNIYGTELVLKFANLKKKKVIITSSSEVYGKSMKSPFSEDDDLVIGPTNKSRWSYACSKAIDEFLAIAYWKEKKLPVVIARLFNTVGPRQAGRYGMVMPRFIQCALKNEPMPICGDGTQTRCFLYVKDAVEALKSLAEKEACLGEIFNIGNPEEISIKELASKIKELAHSKSKLEFISYDEVYEEGFEDMKRRVPDISKIKRFVGFSPEYNLDEILENTIRYILGKKSVMVK